MIKKALDEPYEDTLSYLESIYNKHESALHGMMDSNQQAFDSEGKTPNIPGYNRNLIEDYLPPYDTTQEGAFLGLYPYSLLEDTEYTIPNKYNPFEAEPINPEDRFNWADFKTNPSPI
jgi:hypothetical protein